MISADVQLHVNQLFELEKADDVKIAGKRYGIAAYVVQREKQRSLLDPGGSREAVTRLIGRNEALTSMQFAAEETVYARAAQMMIITGLPGVGKSRLIDEFEIWLRLLPSQVCLFKGRVYQEQGQEPYTLIHDLFASYFDTHRRSSMAIAGEKLVRGISEIMPVDRLQAREQAHYIGQLIGFDFDESYYLAGATTQRIRSQGFEYVAQFFTAVADIYDAVFCFWMMCNGRMRGL